jgi:hypothetical protein
MCVTCFHSFYSITYYASLAACVMETSRFPPGQLPGQWPVVSLAKKQLYKEMWANIVDMVAKTSPPAHLILTNNFGVNYRYPEEWRRRLFVIEQPKLLRPVVDTGVRYELGQEGHDSPTLGSSRRRLARRSSRSLGHICACRAGIASAGRVETCLIMLLSGLRIMRR